MLPTSDELQILVQLANTLGLAALGVWMLVYRDPKIREATASEFRQIREDHNEHVQALTAKFSAAIEAQAKIFRQQIMEQNKLCAEETNRLAQTNREDRNLQHKQILELAQAISHLDNRTKAKKIPLISPLSVD